MQNENLFDRPQYLKELIAFKDTEFIKVISGVRRSGKSYLLKLYRNYLLQHDVTEKQIIYLSFENFENIDLYDPKKLNSFLKERFIPDTKMYLLLVEIQYVKDWQRLINSLSLNPLLDITVTGSNSSLLSGELATLLSGRYVEIHIYPLSFKEMLEFKQISLPSDAEIDRLYSEYVRYGGFPAVVLAKNKPFFLAFTILFY